MNHLWKISVQISPDCEETVENWMTRRFGCPVSIHADFETDKLFADVYLPAESWNKSEEKSLRAEFLNAFPRFQNVRDLIQTTILKKENWAESWKKHFKPIEIGCELLIRPSWSKRKPKPNQAVVVLDPGLSFGTGQHATTHYCLSRLAFLRKQGAQSLLDIGTGSGILAISAAKLRYDRIEAFDFDADCVRTALQNARQNRIGNQLRVKLQDLRKLPVRSGDQFDVICANLTYDLLIEHRRRIVSRLAPGGNLILAGILVSQFPKVSEAFEALHLSQVHRSQKKEWLSAQFARSVS